MGIERKQDIMKFKNKIQTHIIFITHRFLRFPKLEQLGIILFMLSIQEKNRNSAYKMQAQS